MTSKAHQDGTTLAVYAAGARHFHWITAAFVFCLVPVGVYMVNRGAATNFDAVTNFLYSWHKLGGFVLLWIVIARLTYRLSKGAPADEPSLEPWQKLVSHVTHWSIYGLLLLVPLLGWLGVSAYPALGVPGGWSLPALIGADQKLAETLFGLHKAGAMLLAFLVTMHVGAALFHHVIRKDNVLRRMLPGLKTRT
jgi:cytochrome b561